MHTRIRKPGVAVPGIGIDNTTVPVDEAVCAVFTASGFITGVRMLKSDRLQHAFADECVDRLPTNLFDNQSHQDVIAVRVIIIGAWFKQQRLVIKIGNDIAVGPLPLWIPDKVRSPAPVIDKGVGSGLKD